MYFCVNPKKMKYLLSLFISISVFSCKTTEALDESTYFGGEIVNPRSSFVLFLKDDKVIDTLFLDKTNRFMGKYETLDEGLYTFKHGLEFQYVYLQPTDSVLVRLNSWDFDESLVFNGDGGSKNEFLINLFLQNEKEEKAMYQYFNLEEKPFVAKLDSLAKERDSIYREFEMNEISVSDGFKKLTNTAIHYPLYRLKEVYPVYYRKAKKSKEYPNLSKEFYQFRDQVNLNENNLLSFYPYQNYVVNYLYNLAYLQKDTDPEKSDVIVNVLNNIVEEIDSEEIKNTLLKRIVVNDFLKSETTCTIGSEKLAIFLENCTDEEYINQVQNLVNDSKFIENNKQLSNFEVVDYSGNKSDIQTVSKDKKTVIYFWSTEFMSTDYLVSRIQFLERKFSDIQFIGIQMQPAYLNMDNEPKLQKLNNDLQYKLTPNSFANNFLTSEYPRIIIVNSDGIVMNGFTYLDSKKLNQELNKIQKK